MLELDSVTRVFHPNTPNRLVALDSVSLEVEKGAFVVIIGGNGSGKTTLLNAIAGSVAAESGSIRLEGSDITRWPEHRRAHLMGRVFQNPFSGTAPNLTVEENLALAARRGLSRGLGWGLSRRVRDELRARIATLRMGLEDRLQNPMGTLSGGQRQALTLLMATWLKPRLLLLDEHTAALDPRSADQVIRLTEEVIARERLTTLMVTHSMHQAASLGTRLLMLYRGRILHDFRGAEKRRLRPEDLLDRFEDLRRSELLDETAAEMLRRMYV
ncbi:MAG TPA: ATP-binding cassette domain-containing protein [Terriglobales bacterium]|nr:ATP-binding cassette domain-containing protein [Terriglobales bacterium]